MSKILTNWLYAYLRTGLVGKLRSLMNRRDLEPHIQIRQKILPITFCTARQPTSL